MLMQDPLTGRLHEVPDQRYRSRPGEYGRLYGPQWGTYQQGCGCSRRRVASRVVYDGLGNPVGLFPLLTALAPIAAKVAPALAKKFLPQLAKRFLPNLAKRFFPGGAQQLLPMINQALPAIGNFFPSAPPVKPIRRQIAVPPPAFRQPTGEPVNAWPPGPVQGWEYQGRFNGYGRW